MTDSSTDLASKVRTWLSDANAATLCTTLCTKRGGAPARSALDGTAFGSVVPYALTDDGAPFILISQLATHTKNLLADPRASLLVQQPSAQDDPQAGWRLTLVGQMRRQIASAADGPADQVVDEAQLQTLRVRYRAAVPGADRVLALRDFSYWCMRPVHQIRVIEGFGRVAWLEGSVLTST